MSLVPKETAGEVFEDSLARVRRCFGGVATENEDGDSDLEIIADSIIVNLRCPVSYNIILSFHYFLKIKLRSLYFSIHIHTYIHVCKFLLYLT